jgi:hypothetical protein
VPPDTWTEVMLTGTIVLGLEASSDAPIPGPARDYPITLQAFYDGGGRATAGQPPPRWR